MAQALVALSGGAQERKVFLNTGGHFVDGKAITTEASEGEEQAACHDTLDWHQNKATSVSMAALIAEFITEAKMAAGSGGDDGGEAAAGTADLAGVAGMFVGAVDAMTTALTETLRAGIDEMKLKSNDLSEKDASCFNQMVSNLALTSGMSDPQREAAVVAFALEIEQALAFMPDGHAAGGTWRLAAAKVKPSVTTAQYQRLILTAATFDSNKEMCKHIVDFLAPKLTAAANAHRRVVKIDKAGSRAGNSTHGVADAAYGFWCSVASAGTFHIKSPELRLNAVRGAWAAFTECFADAGAKQVLDKAVPTAATEYDGSFSDCFKGYITKLHEEIDRGVEERLLTVYVYPNPPSSNPTRTLTPAGAVPTAGEIPSPPQGCFAASYAAADGRSSAAFMELPGGMKGRVGGALPQLRALDCTWSEERGDGLLRVWVFGPTPQAAAAGARILRDRAAAGEGQDVHKIGILSGLTVSVVRALDPGRASAAQARARDRMQRRNSVACGETASTVMYVADDGTNAGEETGAAPDAPERAVYADDEGAACEEAEAVAAACEEAEAVAVAAALAASEASEAGRRERVCAHEQRAALARAEAVARSKRLRAAKAAEAAAREERRRVYNINAREHQLAAARLRRDVAAEAKAAAKIVAARKASRGVARARASSARRERVATAAAVAAAVSKKAKVERRSQGLAKLRRKWARRGRSRTEAASCDATAALGIKLRRAKDCVTVQLSGRAFAFSTVALADSGAGLCAMSLGDAPQAMVAEMVAASTTVFVGGVNGPRGRMVVGHVAAAVSFEDGVERDITVFLLDGATSLDHRAPLLIGADFLDHHSISRIGGAKPALSAGRRILCDLVNSSLAKAHGADAAGSKPAGRSKSRRRAAAQVAAAAEGRAVSAGEARKAASAAALAAAGALDRAAGEKRAPALAALQAAVQAAAAAANASAVAEQALSQVRAAGQRRTAVPRGASALPCTLQCGDAFAQVPWTCAEPAQSPMGGEEADMGGVQEWMERAQGTPGGSVIAAAAVAVLDDARAAAEEAWSSVEWRVARAASSVYIPGGSVALVRVAVGAAADSPWREDTLLLPSVSGRLAAAAVVAGAVVRRTAAVRVVNASAQGIVVPAGMRLAAACKVRVASAAAAVAAIQVGGGGDRGEAEPEDRTADRPWAARLADISIGEHLTAEERAQVEALLGEFNDVVSDVLRRNSIPEARIDTGGFAPYYARTHRLTLSDRAQMKEEVARLIRLGVVEENVNGSAWNSPLLCVRKPDGGTRVVSDFRKLNDRTVNAPSFPLPDVEATLSELGGMQYHTASDSLHGYWGVGLQRDSRDQTSFCVGQRTYRFTRLPMGVKGASGHFQMGMNAVFARCPATRVFLDDCLTSSASFEAHLRDVRRMLEQCRERRITLKPKKLKVFHAEVKWLGYRVNGSGVSVDDAYLEEIRSKPPPTSLKECRRLVGLMQWVAKFCRGFSRICAPIFEVNKAGVRWNAKTWGPAQERARRNALRELERRTVMAHPTADGEYTLAVDFSQEATGAVLMQQQGDVRVPIAFSSVRNSEREAKYTATEGEALAVIRGLRKMRFWLAGRRFRLCTDHSALQWVSTDPSKSPRLANWRTALLDFDFVVVHKAGVEMQYVDYFSRGGFSERVERPAPENDALARPFAEMYGAPLGASVAAVSLMPASASAFAEFSPEQLRTAQAADGFCAAGQRVARVVEAGAIAAGGNDEWRAAIVEAASDAPTPALRRSLVDIGPELRFNNDGVLTRIGADGASGRLLVPAQLRPAVCAHFHDDAGHGGWKASCARAERLCFWPTMFADMRHYVDSCDQCRSRRGPRRGAHGAMGQLVTPERNFEEWSLDCSGVVRRKGSGERVVVFAAMDARSKYVEACAIPWEGGVTSKQALAAFLHSVVLRYGQPARIVSDAGSEFSGVFSEWAEQAGVAHHLSTRPRHNSCGVERFFGQMWDRMAFMVPVGFTDWELVLRASVAAYNTAPSGVGGLCPHEMVFGDMYATSLERMWQPQAHGAEGAAVDRWAKLVEEQVAQRRAASNRAVARRASGPPQKRGSTVTFAVGDRVWVRNDVRAVGTSTKLLCNFTPGTVTKTLPGTNKYEVRSYITDRVLVRDVEQIRDRTSRAALLAKWDCKPFTVTSGDPGSIGVAAARRTMVEWTAPEMPAARIAKGKAIVFMTAVTNPAGAHAFLAEPQPVPVVGILTSKQRANGSADVRWVANRSKVRMPASTVMLPRDKFYGPCPCAEGGSAAAGSWALYTGPALTDGNTLSRVVASGWERTPEGRASVVFRCRSVGVHPDLDIYGVEDQVREWWPDEAGRKLRSFAEAGESMEGAVRQGAAEEGDRAGPDDV